MFCPSKGFVEERRWGSAALRSLPCLFAKGIFALSALSNLLYGSSRAGEIYLSDFSGNESVVDGSGFYVGTIAPGVRMYGGKEGTVFYWSGNSSYWPQSSDYPFSSSPTDGDPNGFSGASGTGYLSTFLPPGGYYWPLGLTFSFSDMVQRPNRVGLLAANFGSAPYYDKIAVSLTLEGGGSSYYEYGSGCRLLAFQEEVGIVEMNLRWSPGISYGDGPRVSVDDLRFETVPVPEPTTLIPGACGLACSGWRAWRRRKRNRREYSAICSSSRSGHLVLVALTLAGLISHPAIAEVILPDLPIGSKYQLVFVTRGASTGFSPPINQFVRQQAAQNLLLPETIWWGVASLGNPATSNAQTYADIPIFNTGGQRVAINGSAFYSAQHEAPINFDQFGDLHATEVWTGMNPDGGAAGIASLYGGNPAAMLGLSTSTTASWASAGVSLNNLEIRPLYALSEPIVAVPEPASCMMVFGGLACAASGPWRRRIA
jgi:hypothetical protein